MLAPDRFQPVKFKIKNNSGQSLKIFAGGGEVNGESKVVFETDVNDRISLSMSGGVYDKTSAGLYFSMK
jgi:hypothetical protein